MEPYTESPGACPLGGFPYIKIARYSNAEKYPPTTKECLRPKAFVSSTKPPPIALPSETETIGKGMKVIFSFTFAVISTPASDSV